MSLVAYECMNKPLAFNLPKSPLPVPGNGLPGFLKRTVVIEIETDNLMVVKYTLHKSK